MKHIIFSSTLTWVTALLFLASSHAYAQQNIREWVDQSDVVCVASVVSLREVKDATPPFVSQLPMTTLLATLRLQASLKGDAAMQELPLEVYRFNMEAIRQKYPDGFGLTGAMPFSDLKVGRVYLIFAKKHTDNKRFFLVNYSSSYASAIEVGALSKAVSKEAGILTNILQQLIPALSGDDDNIRLRAINLSGTLGDVLWDKPPSWNPGYADLMKKAPDNATLKTLIQSRVIPLVLNLTKSKDTKIRIAALDAAAQLQVPEVIPQLAELVKSESESSGLAAGTLAGYKVFSAVPQLVILLKDSDFNRMLSKLYRRLETGVACLTS